MYHLEIYVKRAVLSIRNADALLITSGAGMGIDSGLPDFRGNEGFWKAYPPIAKLGKSFREMANPDWFHLNPKLAWAFYGHRLGLYRKTFPHHGFNQLLEIARHKKGGYFVFTSNVDGQFQKAGYSEQSIEECHGSIHYLQCSRPCGKDIWDAGDTSVAIDEKAFEALEPLPRCRNCGNIARPNILMFGDGSWIANRTQIQNNHFTNWLKRLSAEKLNFVVIEAGAGKAVATVRNLSERLADLHGATLIRINPRDFEVSHQRHVSLPLGAKEAIGRIFDMIKTAGY